MIQGGNFIYKEKAPQKCSARKRWDFRSVLTFLKAYERGGMRSVINGGNDEIVHFRHACNTVNHNVQDKRGIERETSQVAPVVPVVPCLIVVIFSTLQRNTAVEEITFGTDEVYLGTDDGVTAFVLHFHTHGACAGERITNVLIAVKGWFIFLTAGSDAEYY